MSELHLERRRDVPPRHHALPAERPSYVARLAAHAGELRAAQALRFEVFNLECAEGLAASWATGLDADPFDAACDHLIVIEQGSGRVVGTYRLQPGSRAAAGLGYYGQREFDFAPFEPMRAQVLELGRACVHREHRSFAVLNLLWKGIAAYAQRRGLRYLLGCSSIASRDPAAGLAAYRRLAPHCAEAPWCTVPQPGHACVSERDVPAPPIPRLLAAYLALGARICAPPAIDREFGSIDFLTCLDVESEGLVALQRRGRFTA